MKNKPNIVFLFLTLLLSVLLTPPHACNEKISNPTDQFEKVFLWDSLNNNGIKKHESEENKAQEQKSGSFFSQNNWFEFPIFIQASKSGSQKVFSGRFSRSPPCSAFS
jgi:hypothetical protein